MNFFFVQKYIFLFLLWIIVIVSVGLGYLLAAGNAFLQQPDIVTPTANLTFTPPAELTQFRSQKPCSSKPRNFQAGIAFPQWGSTAYGENDTKWLAELPDMRTQTAACWVEIPLLFYQPSLTSTTVMAGSSTATLSSFTYGLHFAHDLGLHVFVTPLLGVGGPQPWSGAIQYATYEQAQHWFQSYWQAIKPYAVAAAQAGVEQFALGTEYQWLQENAPDSLWNGLIAQLRSVFPGTLTYDMNWTSLQSPPRFWMHNANLKMIGVSAYVPLIDTPERVDPRDIFNLWKQTVKRALDDFAFKLGEPLFISEIGYRNSTDALYRAWESTSSAPPDPQEQAAACGVALANIIPDQHILGSFFWGWDDAGAFNLTGLPATTEIHTYYTSLRV